MLLITLPTRSTQRLILRPFSLEDAGVVEQLAGNIEVARFTANIPHPYPVGGAAKWIATHLPDFLEEKAIVLAIQEIAGPLIGCVQLSFQKEHRRAEIGYWIGQPYWGRGYCSEAARDMLDYGFREWDLHRIFAHHMISNPASGRVMQKIGMTHEGTLREHTVNNGLRSDLVVYGILRDEWLRETTK